MADWFEPGFKAGGTIRSSVNFARYLKNDLEIFVLTTDRDFGDTAPYSGIAQNTWLAYDGNVQVFYASPEWLSWGNVKKLILSIHPGIIYLNSMYSKYFSLYPLLMKRFGTIRSKLLLAPRGMLRESAVTHKRFKKTAFLSLFKTMRLHKRVTFHATDATEYEDIRNRFGRHINVSLVPDFPSLQTDGITIPEKDPSSLKMFFVGRIHPIKNLDFILHCIAGCKHDITLTIIGAIEDVAYWNKCSGIINSFGGNIKVNMLEAQPVPRIQQVMNDHHLFVLPTRGENFGHAIFESLAAGRPVLISDQTPWRDLTRHKAGWDLSLDAPARFKEVVEEVTAMNREQLKEWCCGAKDYCKNYLETSGIKEQYLKLFS